MTTCRQLSLIMEMRTFSDLGLFSIMVTGYGHRSDADLFRRWPVHFSFSDVIFINAAAKWRPNPELSKARLDPSQ